MKGPVLIALAAAVGCGALAAAPRTASKKAAPVKGKQASAAAKKPAATAKKPAVAPAGKPRPLSAKVKKGLDWLATRQLKSGGWGQGEESEAMGQQMDAQRDKANVADTCIAALALIRSGSTPHSGSYQENIRRALDYVCGEVEKSDAKSMQVSSTQGTRVQ